MVSEKICPLLVLVVLIKTSGRFFFVFTNFLILDLLIFDFFVYPDSKGY